MQLSVAVKGWGTVYRLRSRYKPEASATVSLPSLTLPARGVCSPDPRRLSLRLEVCLDEPQPLVDAARHLGEQVGRVQVAQLVGLVDALPRRRAEGRQGRGQRLDVAAAVHRAGRVLGQRTPP